MSRRSEAAAQETRDVGTVRRQTLADARGDRLFFAQVREDPLLEIEALRPRPTDTLVVVSSGGCTALSLLAAGAGQVVAVDVNPVQNHLLELKAAAVAGLPRHEAIAFLGGAPATDRRRIYALLREDLTDEARVFWDARPSAVRKGAIHAGLSERFIALVTTAIRTGIHPRSRIERLLACRSLEEQRSLYRREWNTRRWRALFHVLLNRFSFNRALDPSFFRHLERPSFARHFLARAEHALTEVPVGSNYFLHEMLTGFYAAGVPGGLPPYLSEDGAAAVARNRDRLTLVDGSLTEYLKGLPDGSVDGFALSNIGEWLDAQGLDRLFAQVVRTARPGASLCFRNFVGWTEVPERWRHAVVEDRARGEALIHRDRSVVQRRLAVCRIHKDASGLPRIRVREAVTADNGALLGLAAACPMEGDVGLCITREPDFFALTRLEGESCRVGIAEAQGSVAGCVAVAQRSAYVHGRPVRMAYLGDLKVHPAYRGGEVADALSRHALQVAATASGDDGLLLMTVLAGNQTMERRVAGRPGVPPARRIATIRAHAVPLLWPRRVHSHGIRVAAAAAPDLEEMAALWTRVGPGRQFATVFTAETLAAWIEAAPGLDISSYQLARRSDGRLAGFLAVWDTSCFKQLRVTGYSARMTWFRAAHNALAPLTRAAALPPAGAPLRGLSALHVCVPPEEIEVLRALLEHVYREWRGRGYAFISVGLDRRDPLTKALRGFLAQPTDVGVYVAHPRRSYEGAPLDDRPIHHEIALV